jgi:hypothetical protein
VLGLAVSFTSGCGNLDDTAISSIAADASTALIRAKLGAAVATDQYLLVVSVPKSAAEVWLCEGPSSGVSCDKFSIGAKPLRLAQAAGASDLAFFALPSGIALRGTVAESTAVVGCSDSLGQSLGQQGLRFTKRGTPGVQSIPTGSMQPPADIGALRPVPGAAIALDFPGTFSRSNPSAGVVRLKIQSGALLGKSQINVTGKLVNLRDSVQTLPLQKSVTVAADGFVDFMVDGLAPETVYRIDGLMLAGADGGGTESVEDPYFVVTSGSGRLAEARRLLVMKALAEAYDWDHENYDTRKQYTENQPNGWCDQFYVWAGQGITSMSYSDYAPNWYEQNRALLGNDRFLTTAGAEAVHGDLARTASHSFMILSYDKASGTVFTVEGNFNSRVERYKRQVSEGWEFGHLSDGLLR